MVSGTVRVVARQLLQLRLEGRQVAAAGLDHVARLRQLELGAAQLRVAAVHVHADHVNVQPVANREAKVAR